VLPYAAYFRKELKRRKGGGEEGIVALVGCGTSRSACAPRTEKKRKKNGKAVRSRERLGGAGRRSKERKKGALLTEEKAKHYWHKGED